MKKMIMLLSLSLLSLHHPTQCARSMEEYGVFGAGAITTFFGLKLLNSACGEKGTKKQGFFGTLFTASGITMMLAGPSKVKAIHKQNTAWYRAKTNGRNTWREMNGEAKKIAASSALQDQIDRESRKQEPNLWTLSGLQCAQWIIEHDPTNTIVKLIPWPTLLEANL